MRKPPYDQATTLALDSLETLAWAAGPTPIISQDAHPGWTENEAARMAAGDFIQAIIAQAEQQAVGNRTPAVRAAMIEAWSWLLNLEDMDLEEREPDDRYLEDSEEMDPDPCGETSAGYDTLRRAEERLGEAALRYASHLSGWDPEQRDGMPLLNLWRSVVAPPGYIAMLRHHLAALSESEEAGLTSGHNMAAQDMAVSLDHQLGELAQMSRLKTSGPRPSVRQMQRCMNEIRNALQEFGQAENLIRRTRTIRFHPAMDAADFNEGQEMARMLAGGDEKYAISLNPGQPAESIIAYDAGSCIRVKRIVDHYEDNDEAEIASEHALAFISMSEHTAEEHGARAAEQHRELARMLCYNIAADMHQVDRGEFAGMIQAMRQANNDPLAVREAAAEALLHGSSGLDLLFSLADEDEDPPSIEQAQAVINAARETGLNDGLMRALCKVMRADPDMVGAPALEVRAEMVAEALEMCPMELHQHQATKIARTLGANEEDPAIAQWIDRRCSDAGEEDDDEDEEDAGYEDDEPGHRR